MLQLGAIILISEITVVFVLSFAQLALLSIGEEHARQRGRVIEDLELVEFVAYAFAVVVHLTGFEKGFILRFKYRFLVIAGAAALRLIHVTVPQNDGAEELENTFFDLAKR